MGKGRVPRAGGPVFCVCLAVHESFRESPHKDGSTACGWQAISVLAWRSSLHLPHFGSSSGSPHRDVRWWEEERPTYPWNPLGLEAAAC